MAIDIVTFALGPLDTNCFLLHDGKEAVIVDVGGEPAEVLAFLKQHGLRLTDILITHMHFDHVLGVAALAAATGATARGNQRDAFILEAGNSFGFPNPQPFTLTNLDEGPASFLGATCSVLGTPGHTPGSLSYYFSQLEALFSGDVLFYRSVGRTDFTGGNAKELTNSIRQKIFTLPDNTTVYPGHMAETLVGDEKRLNPFVAERK